MALVRRGGVKVGGSSQVIGQPSTPPTVRQDIVSFDVPFDRDAFTQLIRRRGYNVVWEKATLCPFLKGPSPKDHDLTCKLCKNGYMYFGAVSTRMIVSSLGLAQQYFAYGQFDPGKAQITAFPEMKLSFFDRVTLVDARARHTDRVMRQRGTLRDRPKFDPIEVVDLRWATSDTTFQTAVQGVDFNLDATTGEIVWVTTNRPNADQWYSTVYHYRPVYIVMDDAHYVRDQQIMTPDSVNDKPWEFPVQVIGQLDRFVREEGRDPSNESDVANPFPTQSQTRWSGA